MVSDQVRKSSKAIFPFPQNDGTSSDMSTNTEQQIIEDTKMSAEPGARIAEFRFILQIAIMMQLSLFSPLKVSAQNIGFTKIGSTSYPTAIAGNNVSLNTSLHVDSNYLVADQYTTTVPLTAVQTMTNGSGDGNVKISIYSNATGNVPGSKLCTEIQVTGISTSGWTTYNITRTYLPTGTCWIFFNCSNAKGAGQTNTTVIPGRYFAQSFSTAFQNDVSTPGWSVIAGNADASHPKFFRKKTKNIICV